MRTRPFRTRWLVGFALGFSFSMVQAQVPPHQEKQIQKVAKQVKAQVAPKKARTVLIFNTPPALMAKDPHKGYCIPYGEAALKAIGVATGAFKPVVSDDIACFAPENIKQFDAIVLNNSSGPWITPTAADMEKDSLKKLGADASALEAALRTSFLAFIENGGGVVSIHFAVAADKQWPQFKEIFGATFTGHPWNEGIGVTDQASGTITKSAPRAGRSCSRSTGRSCANWMTRTRSLQRGWLAVQLHVGPPMLVQFKDIVYRKL